MGHIAERSGNIITVCHRCQERETLHHLFTCTNNTTSKKLYIDSITQALTQAKTEINIQNTLIHGLHIHLALPTTYNVPISLQHCFHTQTTYGWQLVCAGLLIQQWSQHQQLHQIDTNTPHSPLAGDIWNRKISSALIRQAHQIWITRCSEVHDTSPTYSKAQLETIAQLHRLYQNSELLPYTDRQKIFSDPIDTHIAKGCKHISLWIRRNAKAIKKLHSKRRLGNNQRPITHFFTHTARDPNPTNAIRITGPTTTTIPKRSESVQTGPLQRHITHYFHTTITTTEQNTTDTDNHETTTLSNKTQPQSESTALETGR